MHCFNSSAANLETNLKLSKAKEDFERLFNIGSHSTQGTGFYFSYHADLSVS